MRAVIAALDAHYLAGLDPALRRLDLPAPVIDDVKQDVRQRLLVADGARPPRIADFTGAGNLRGWLRVVAINAARQLLRRAAPPPSSPTSCCRSPTAPSSSCSRRTIASSSAPPGPQPARGQHPRRARRRGRPGRVATGSVSRGP
jgi:DNA-directed RNA polymerase specialized sigma24 family protein